MQVYQNFPVKRLWNIDPEAQYAVRDGRDSYEVHVLSGRPDYCDCGRANCPHLAAVTRQLAA